MINNTFRTPIISQKIPTETYKVIKDDVMSFISNNPDKFKESWQCPTLSTIDIAREHNLRSMAFEQLLLQISYHYCEIYEFPDMQLTVTDYWVNIARKGAYQESHTHLDFHKKFMFSGVMYIDVSEDCGNLVLENPTKHLHHYMLPTKLMHDIEVKPKNGLLVSFPSWMKHEAQINKSDSDRISLSWNIEASGYLTKT